MLLSWDDLIIDDITPEECELWLQPWAGIVTGRVSPIFLNRFGSWFLRRPEGHVDLLNIFSGEIERVAEDFDQFQQEVNQSWWQEVYLLSNLVAQLHEAGKIPGSRQCYALAPHPAIGGPNPLSDDPISPQGVMLMDIPVWQSLCAQFCGR